MWGSSFADLARKAQELQEQAASISSVDIFNLDSMQPGKPKETKHPNQEDQITSTAQSTKPSFSLSSADNVSTQVATPKPPPPPPKGKLKFVTKLSPKVGAKKIEGKKVEDKTIETTIPAPESVNAEAVPSIELAIKPPPEPKVEKLEGAQLESHPDFESTTPNDSAALKDPSVQEKEVPEIEAQSASVREVKLENVKESATKGEDVKEFKSEMTDDGGNVSEKAKIGGEPNREVEDAREKEPVADKELSEDTVESPSDAEPNEQKEPAEIQTEQVEVTEQVKTEGGGDAAATTAAASKDEAEVKKDQEQTESNGSGETESPKIQSSDTTASKSPEQEENVAKLHQEPKEEQSPEPTSSQREAPVISSHSTAGQTPEDVMNHFAAQLQRLQANFEAERKEMREEHGKALADAVAQKERKIEEVQTQLKEKALKVKELLRIKEGNELRMDSLKREVAGIKELLQQRDKDAEESKAAVKKEKEQLEQMVRSLELELGRTKAELKALKDQLASAQGQVGETNQEYENLKSRVKVVAGELKDRRAECRELKNKIEELEEVNATLEDRISSLDAQLSDRDRSGSEKEDEVNSLRSEIELLHKKLREGDQHVEELTKMHEANLANYKKKAQSSLAVANARAAAAIQAKEEAELEARAARCTADATMERARISEAKGEKAMLEAKEVYREMEEQRNAAVKELEALKDEFTATRNNLEALQKKLDALLSEKEELTMEMTGQSRSLETERAKANSLQYELGDAQHRIASLQKDINDLRSRLQKAETAATSNAKKPTNAPQTATDPATAAIPSDDSGSKLTIMMLQKQLQEANQTIKELKDALESAVEMSAKSNVAAEGASPLHPADGNSGGSMGSPLFYAMEKQAELNTARNEINRLASLYADVQSEKVEAEEQLNAARKELDEERAKLQRYEKLGSVSQANSTAGAAGDSNGLGHQKTRSDASNTNIEYLKNIMMSFLNAKTLAERKSLVPVIGAVLCLTAEEQSKAIQNVEATGGIEGFSTAFFETIGSRVNR